MSAWAKLSRFVRRFMHFKQMDFEFASWQMLYLLIQPQKVYRNFLYRKRTKDQFARDDPAFLVLLSLSLLFSSVFYAVALGLPLWGFVKFFLWVVFIDCIGVGLVVATILWWSSNRFLRKVQDQDVEWGYCFDVHLNAFFPMLILLHVLLPIIYPSECRLPLILPILLWLIHPPSCLLLLEIQFGSSQLFIMCISLFSGTQPCQSCTVRNTSCIQ
ncbi:UNC-50 family protein [Necator americanus]|uniref:UNC-50 family protein n=1 Tax=Necator americanus TaxID=51031 RepID=W2TQV1_NECAM|nr:UNC-50 family protein [Necator americanus]ETN84163.1 UNC-50 family protein [Necator americanus]